MSKKKDKPAPLFVDIRFTFKEFREEWEDGEFETWIDLKNVTRHKVKGLTDDDLRGVGESFAQMDRYQEMLASDLVAVISDGYTFRNRR